MNTLNKIKCFQVIPNLGEGGAEKLALSLADAIDKDKYDVTLVSLYKSQESIYEQLAREKGLKIKFFNKKPGLDLMVICHLIKYFLKEKPQIIHTHLYSVKYIFLPAVLSGVKVRIHTVHSLADKELGWLDRCFMKVMYCYFNFIPVAISDFIRETLVAEYHLPSTRIPCIYNGIDVRLYTPGVPREFKANPLKICAIGSLRNIKNHHLLIEAFKLALEKNQDISLQIVGDGVLRKELEAKVKMYGLQDKVIFMGVRSDIPGILSQSDVFAISSLHEGLPLSVLEAMASGLPIIATRVGGIPDVMTEGRNGFLVESGNVGAYCKAILKLVDDPKLREIMSRNNLKDAWKYDVKVMAKGYEDLYASCL